VTAVAVFLAAILLFGPLRHSMAGAEADIVLIALVVASFRALADGHRVASGLVLGLVIAVKPTYAILLVVHLWQRQWRAAMVALLAGAAAVAVPFMIMPHHAVSDFQTVAAYVNSPGALRAPRSNSV